MRHLTIAALLNEMYEGFRSKPYLCPANVWTVGIGSTMWQGRPVTQHYPKTVTREEALSECEAYFVRVGKEFCGPSWDLLNANQKAALLVFSYNTGWQPGDRDFVSLNKAYWTNDPKLPKILGMYVKADGKVLLGLQRRRRAEGLLWYGKSPQEAFDQAALEYPAT
jgi:lysozyme